MSHVGRGAVRLAWAVVVLPALLLSYAGQAAVLQANPHLAGNPFFATVPRHFVPPLVALATLATIIASQAIVTGTFTLTRQAMQLGWFPGLDIRQTSDTEYGQIYVPTVNWVLMLATIAVALMFRSSDALSGAYGTAVSTTMLMTTLLVYDVMRLRWRWPRAVAVPTLLLLLVVDIAFFAANLLKIADGGYVPVLIGLAIFLVMTTWHRGIELVRTALAPLGQRADEVLARLRAGTLPRIGGEAVFLSRGEMPVPPLVCRYVAHFGSLPPRVVVLSVWFENIPRIAESDRITLTELATDYWHLRVHFGFVEVPNLMLALGEAKRRGVTIDPEQVTFFAARDDIVPHYGSARMVGWRRAIFGFAYRNAVRASDRFALPRDRLVELGHQIEI